MPTMTETLPVQPKQVIWNPGPDELLRLSFQMPNARKTRYGSPNVQTRVDSRSKESTFVITDTPQNHSGKTMTVKEGQRMAAVQDEYIKNKEMIVIDGYIGNRSDFRTATRLIIEKSNANIARMQQILYFPVPADERPNFKPTLTIIYTPNLVADGFPDSRLISVDLEKGITRVFNSDYFGESKKGGLRMWNKLVYDRGGLPMHAGAKIIPVPGKQPRIALIIGLSGTGKTTTTFTKQNDSQPIQDDFLALMPSGKVYATENGCFAKTFALDPKSEPTIHKAVTTPYAYLENVFQSEQGELDFFNTSYTQNGRAVIRMSDIDGAYDSTKVDRADMLLILNRNDNLIPGVARLSPVQAAAYFMLGETQGTSAGGKSEMGKFLRIPGTNPFFPMLHDLQGNRFVELLKKLPMEVYLLNTGRVGGPEGDSRSKKIKIHHSSAIVKALAEGTIQWEKDPDFGYEVASRVPEISKADLDILQPRRLYASQNRQAEYQELVKKYKKDRAEYMAKYPKLNPDIVKAIL